MKTKQKLQDEIADLCEQAGCNEEMQKLHRQQYVFRRWNPHPPQSFLEYFSHHPHFKAGCNVTEAFNCARYRIQWYCAKVANLTAEQSARIETQLAPISDARQKYVQSMLAKRKMKPEDVTAYFDDLVRDLFAAIKADQPLRPILERMGVYDEPEIPRTVAEGFQKLKAAIAKIGAQMDMNKAIGWTKAESDAIKDDPPNR